MKIRFSIPTFPQWITAIGFLILYVPLFALILYSFVEPQMGLTNQGSQWTLNWYRKLFQNKPVFLALRESLVIGFWSTLVSTLLGTMAALAMSRSRFPGRKLFEFLTYFPLVMPEIVLGLSLLIWFVALRVALGSFSIILAHITFSLSYVMITIRARLQGFDESLEDAARDLGANGWQVFLKVTFPLIFPGILSAALIAFTLSFDDFLITFFTAGVGSDTLPLKIYSMIKFGVSPEINALSTLMIGSTLLLVALFSIPFRK